MVERIVDFFHAAIGAFARQASQPPSTALVEGSAFYPLWMDLVSLAEKGKLGGLAKAGDNAPSLVEARNSIFWGLLQFLRVFPSPEAALEEARRATFTTESGKTLRAEDHFDALIDFFIEARLRHGAKNLDESKNPIRCAFDMLLDTAVVTQRAEAWVKGLPGNFEKDRNASDFAHTVRMHPWNLKNFWPNVIHQTEAGRFDDLTVVEAATLRARVFLGISAFIEHALPENESKKLQNIRVTLGGRKKEITPYWDKMTKDVIQAALHYDEPESRKALQSLLKTEKGWEQIKDYFDKEFDDLCTKPEGRVYISRITIMAINEENGRKPLVGRKKDRWADAIVALAVKHPEEPVVQEALDAVLVKAPQAVSVHSAVALHQIRSPSLDENFAAFLRGRKFEAIQPRQHQSREELDVAIKATASLIKTGNMKAHSFLIFCRAIEQRLAVCRTDSERAEISGGSYGFYAFPPGSFGPTTLRIILGAALKFPRHLEITSALFACLKHATIIPSAIEHLGAYIADPSREASLRNLGVELIIACLKTRPDLLAKEFGLADTLNDLKTSFEGIQRDLDAKERKRCEKAAKDRKCDVRAIPTTRTIAYNPCLIAELDAVRSAAFIPGSPQACKRPAGTHPASTRRLSA